jgi:hypothetical protein
MTAGMNLRAVLDEARRRGCTVDRVYWTITPPGDTHMIRWILVLVTALVLALVIGAPAVLTAQVMCPNGSYVGTGPCICVPMEHTSVAARDASWLLTDRTCRRAVKDCS